MELKATNNVSAIYHSVLEKLNFNSKIILCTSSLRYKFSYFVPISYLCSLFQTLCIKENLTTLV